MRRLRGGVALVLGAALVAGLTITHAHPVSAGPDARPAAVIGATTVRPRLLFSPDDVPALRARFADTTKVPGQAMARVVEKAEHHLLYVQPAAVQAGMTIDPFNISHDTERPYNLQGEMPTYLIELAFAYQMSGNSPLTRNQAYGRRAIDLVSALGDKNFPYWSWQDLGIGDLDEGLALAIDMTWEMMTAAERTKVIGDIVRLEAHLIERPLLKPWNAFAANLNNSNWMGVTTGGAGLLLLTLKGLPGVPAGWYAVDPATPPSYWEAALARIADFLHHSVDPNGAYDEGLTYTVYGMKNAVPFAKALERAGYPNQFAGTGLPRMARWMVAEQLPGEGQNYVPLNDSQRTMYGVDLFSQLFAIAPNDGVAQWLWHRSVGPLGDDYYREPHVTYTAREDKCDQPFELVSTAGCDLYQFHGNVWAALWYRTPAETPEVDPETVGPLSVHHARRGLVDARTGYAGGTHEAVSTFEARRDGYPHYQYDLGGFTLYGEGGRWAIDPGYSCVACKKPRAQMNAAELAQDEDGAYATFHNVVVIDNDTYTQKHGSRFNIVNDRSTEADDLKTIDSFVDAPNLSLAHADLRYAYEFAAPYAGRDHFFSRVPGRPVLLGIADQVKRDGANHLYRWQLMTNNDNVVTTSGSTFTITHGAPMGASVVGRTAAGATAAQDPSVQLDTRLLRNPTDDEGKVMPMVFTQSPAQATMEHLAFMALTPAGAPAATTETLRVGGGNAIGITWNGVQDVLVRRIVGASAVSGDIATDAELAKFARDGGETVLRGGTRLAAFGRDYVTVGGVASPATVTVSGTKVAATGGSADNRYRVFAPTTIDGAAVNGVAVPFTRDGQYVSFPVVVTPPVRPAVADFDGNGATDISLYRSGGRWFALNTGPETTTYGGLSGDIPVPADYDGDGDTDMAIRRPSTREWYIRGAVPEGITYGLADDIPVPGDYDGDGDADIALYRPSTGTWYVRGAATEATVFGGLPGDVPVPADYDGDGDTDMAIRRPSTREWYVRGSAVVAYGLADDIPVPADYDGDGDADIALYRPSSGTWFVRGATPESTVYGGLSGDIPVPGDYDGDGDTDLSIRRPSTRTWYVRGATPEGLAYGLPGDIPLPLPFAVRRAFFAV